MNQKHDKVLVGDLKCIDLSSDVIKEILQEDVDKDSMYVASQKREYIQRVWNYSIKNSKAKVLENIKNPASFSMVDWIDWKKEPSEKFIEAKDFPEFFKVVDSIGRSDFRDIIKMSLFTGQHPYAEIAKMRWDQIQEVEGQTWWIMEKGFHKIDKPHNIIFH